MAQDIENTNTVKTEEQVASVETTETTTEASCPVEPVESDKDRKKRLKAEEKARKAAEKAARQTVQRTDYKAILTTIVTLVGEATRTECSKYLRAGLLMIEYMQGKARDMKEAFTSRVRADELGLIKSRIYQDAGITIDPHTLLQCGALVNVLDSGLVDRMEAGNTRILPWSGFKNLMGMVQRIGDTEEWNLNPAHESCAMTELFSAFLDGKDGYKTAEQVKEQWDRVSGKVKVAPTTAETAAATEPQGATASAPAVQIATVQPATAETASAPAVQPETKEQDKTTAVPQNLLAVSNPTKPALVAVQCADLIVSSDDQYATMYDLSKDWFTDQEDWDNLLAGVADQEDGQTMLSYIVATASSLLKPAQKQSA